MATRYLVPAVKRAFEIIDFLARQNGNVGISEIRSALGLPLSSTANIMYTLADLGYVERDETDASYRLSVKLLGIARQAHDRIDLVTQCHGLLGDAVRESGLTGHIAVLRESDSMYVDRVPSNALVQVNSYVGQRWPAHTSAVGKAILAFLPEPKLEHLLKDLNLAKRTPYTITSRSVLLKQLRTFRRIGYAWERNEGEVGLGCVAAPILDAGGTAVAAMSLTGTTHQISGAKLRSLGRLVRSYARKMAQRLGTENS